MSDSNTPTVQRKTALAPDLRKMPDRAARAWTERMAVRHLGGADYAVDSQSGATYVVDAREGTCTCPDATIRGETCKHQRRVALEITSRRVPPPGKRRADCAACGAEAFVPEASRPPALCEACELDPGDVVLDRETGDRLVVVAVTDRRADEVTIEAADTTVADYPTNDGYPTDDLVVEVRYLPDAASGHARTYLFPLSRLQQVDDAALVDA
ncbi:MAG: SWIM zinc finger family protein [Haloarculaceae archaeon]